MTRIDFYQINTDETALQFACRLIEKIYRSGHRVYVHLEDGAARDELDELLWSHRHGAFLPHGLLSDETPSPIQLGTADDPGDHRDVMVNLTGGVPTFFSRFERLTEVVPKDPASREAARSNYRFYQERGYQLAYHQID